VEEQKKRLEELQRQIVETRAEQEQSKKRKDEKRMLDSTRKFSQQVTLIADVKASGERGMALVEEHADAERARLARITSLEKKLAAGEIRQQQLKLRCAQQLREMPPTEEARDHVRQLQQHEEYGQLLQQQAELGHQYHLTEHIMLAGDYNWRDDRDWMERIRPEFHNLPRPSHLFIALENDQENVPPSDNE